RPLFRPHLGLLQFRAKRPQRYRGRRSSWLATSQCWPQTAHHVLAFVEHLAPSQRSGGHVEHELLQSRGRMLKRSLSLEHVARIEIELLLETRARRRIRGNLDCRRDAADEAVAYPGGEQNDLRAGGDETPHGFRRVRGRIHQVKTGTRQRIGDRDDATDRRASALGDRTKRL